MPTYIWRCHDHGDFSGWRSIHDESTAAVCPTCGELSVKVLTSPQVALSVRASRAEEPGAQAVAREARWDRDMPAYKRLRHDGVQPRGIDGAARIEALANTTTEVEMGKIMPMAKVREGTERSAEILGQEVV